MDMRDVKLVLSEEASKEYLELQSIVGEEHAKGITSSENQSLLRSLERAREILKVNPTYGDHVERKKIPKEYVQKYGIDNLWRVELSKYWRLLYTLKGSEVEIITFVLDIMDHERYDKLFGYRKK